MIRLYNPDLICLQETRDKRIYYSIYDFIVGMPFKKSIQKVISKKLDFRIINNYVAHDLSQGYGDHYWNKIEQLMKSKASIFARLQHSSQQTSLNILNKQNCGRIPNSNRYHSFGLSVKEHCHITSGKIPQKGKRIVRQKKNVTNTIQELLHQRQMNDLTRQIE
ncbi:UNKNOWN [Stylonychia lemnae]|uniref:Uncharacterized protein n=1 Tax=Stylonychia lemnae TaxID=5949 RepID=A0A077ZXB2_STYLE|nr:UNKNOWN [Stylonychia lemnae]|eukprot:CDW74535.1 UNKNOWN [Stylonychia lemnae]